MQKRKLTQEDLDTNPELSEKGLKAVEEIEVPENETDSDEGSYEQDMPDDTGGSNPPPNKERP